MMKRLMFAIVALVAVVSVAVAAMELALSQQDADARGCKSSLAVNASQGRCFGHGPSAAEEDTDSEEDTDDD
jgi:uncharacterized low-complexity protein